MSILYNSDCLKHLIRIISMFRAKYFKRDGGVGVLLMKLVIHREMGKPKQKQRKIRQGVRQNPNFFVFLNLDFMEFKNTTKFT